MTWLEQLSTEEQNAIEELKRRTIHDLTPKLLEDPSLFYRFLKARNFNIKNAESMLRKHISFRKEYGIDTILEDYKPPEVLVKYTPSNFFGFDKDGSPVRYVTIAAADIKGFLNSVKKADIIKYNVHLIEQDMLMCKQQSEKLGKLVTTVVYIDDFKDLTFAKATNKDAIDLMKLGATIYQDNYPERIKSIYCINSSIYFTMIFSIVKMVVAPAVIEKIHVHGTEGWKEALLGVIDGKELPAFLGGERTDPDGDPLCKTVICHGGDVPEHYYLKKSKKTLYLEPGVKKLHVTRFSSANITFEITVPDSTLEWDFETKSRDIGFALYYKDKRWNSEKLVELVPKQRIDTGFEPESGVYRCEKAGTYIMMFDNSYSWIYPKEIYYRATVLPPDKDSSQLHSS
ncbi:SEC14-like protein 2 isoform X2 [Parasteatoda tepidariorum]|uniref:SEC14-like protein 2 isoform X2 n=1 Tax=Parasteatoda tepidariorum TaxID=114398 RepID=UPI0039BCCA2F